MRAPFPRLVRFVAVAASLLVIAPAGPALAATSLPDASRGALPAAVQERVSQARAALATGRFMGLLAAAGVSLPTHTSPAGDGTSGAIRVLATAVRRATAIVRSTVPMRRGLALGHDARVGLDTAAAVVATALDATLPRLTAAAPAPTHLAVDGCEIQDQAPVLCVAGSGNNVITKDYALVVDLGGDDLHADAAGGADALGNGLPVSVTVDLGGNDTYDAAVPTASGSLVAQGSGFLGVGFLVDAAGNDTYRAVSEEADGVVRAQGASLHGVGVLADLGGNDGYEITATGQGDMRAMGQAEGADGVGILQDAGGDDHYDVSATATGFFATPVGFAVPPSAEASGIGMAQLGHIIERAVGDADYAGRSAALFADAGGTDALHVTATVPDPGHDEMFGPGLLGWPYAEANGIGFGAQGSTGLVLLGSGDTDSSVIASSDAQLSDVGARGIGFAANAGTGVVSDLGGDDTRRLEGNIHIERATDLREDCGCPEPGVGAASHEVTVAGLGATRDFGTGVLDDQGSGTDRYAASSSNVVRTTVQDDRPDGVTDAAQSYATAGDVQLTVEGAADNGGWGYLRDAGGDDHYEITAGSTAGATAARGPSDPAPQAHATAGDAFVLGQGSARSLGTGVIADLGGSDAYAVTSAVASEAEPATEVAKGEATAAVLASVDQGSIGSFVDDDGGATDTFQATPGEAACTGTRGQGTWVDCGGAGVGLMA